MSVNRNTTVLEKLPLPEQQLVSKRKKKEQQRWSASATALKESYHSSSQQFILGGVQTKIVNSVQRLLQFLSNSGKPPLGTSAPCPGSRQNPSTPWIVLRTSRNVFLGGPPVVPAFPIHPGTSNKSECFLEHEPGLKAPGMALPQGGLSLVEPGWQQLASLLSPVPTLRKKTNPLITMPVQYDYCTRGTKWPHLGEKKKSWLKCSIMLTPLCYLEHDSNKNNAYHWAAYWDFSTLPRSCQEKGKHYSSSMHGYDTLFFLR